MTIHTDEQKPGCRLFVVVTNDSLRTKLDSSTYRKFTVTTYIGQPIYGKEFIKSKQSYASIY